MARSLPVCASGRLTETHPQRLGCVQFRGVVARSRPQAACALESRFSHINISHGHALEEIAKATVSSEQPAVEPRSQMIDNSFTTTHAEVGMAYGAVPHAGDGTEVPVPDTSGSKVARDHLVSLGERVGAPDFSDISWFRPLPLSRVADSLSLRCTVIQLDVRGSSSAKHRCADVRKPRGICDRGGRCAEQ